MHPYLSKILASQRIPHALLFVGTNLEEAAYAFVAALLCKEEKHCYKISMKVHPDIHIYRPEGRSGLHSLQSMHALCQEVVMYPHEASMKCFIICEAERMLPSSANALLKTFEEPTPSTLLILLSSKPDTLLPTMLSRCQKIFFPSSEKREITPIEETFLELLTGERSFQKIKSLSSKIEQKREQLEQEMRQTIPEDLTPKQKEGLEKEVLGAATLQYQEEVFALFKIVLEWYRDHYLYRLIKTKESPLFFHPQYLSNFERVALPLDKVEAVIQQATLGIERSMKLETCLEGLLLQLN